MPDLKKAVEAEREPGFLTAAPERKLLRWIAARLPRWILPDDLTLLGVLAAFGVCAAYQLSNNDLAWLWAASGLGIVAVMVGVLALRVMRNLHDLSRREPAASRRTGTAARKESELAAD